MAEVNSDFSTKKKNVCDSIIFEVDIADCSPEHSPKNSTSEEYSKKSTEHPSQDSGVFSQESKTSQELEISESQFSQESSNKSESSCVNTKNGAACDETDYKLEVVESQISSEVQSADDALQTVERSLHVAKFDDVCHLSETQSVVAEEKQAIVEEHVSSITVSEKIEVEKQENVEVTTDVIVSDEKQVNVVDVGVELYEKQESVAQTTTITKEDVVIVSDEKQMDVVSCETVDGINRKNVPEESELLEKTNAISIISVSFKDVAIANEYKSNFLKFLCAYPELNVVETDENSLTLQIVRDADLPTHEWIVMDETVGESAKQRSRKRKRSERKKEDEMFMVDTSPSITTKENASLRYTSKFCVSENKGEENAEEVKTGGSTCFNCDGNHSLKDCTEPKNYAKINMARNSYKSNQIKSARYHLEEDQMYSHLSPGKVSDKLRKALGLRKNDLPPYIYRMRILGYPPGWIKEAEEEASNLCMFDIEGKSVSSHKRKKFAIDPEKIVAYPGFNVPMEDGAHDDYRYYGVPPFSIGHDKQVMIDFINRMKAKEEDDLEICDMDVDKSFNETITEVSENDVSQDSQDVPQENSRMSPTLNDLESRKQQLLAELDTNTTSTSDSLKSCDPDTKESSASVKTSSFGTPILKSASPYSKLPRPDNFSQNISPVINFENLPNATGKYEQMTGILHKVRTSLKGLQGEKKT